MTYLAHNFKVLKHYLPLHYAGAANNEACIKDNKNYFLPRGDINITY